MTAAQANQQALLACLDDTDRAAAGDVGQGDIMAQDSASQDPEPGAEPPKDFEGPEVAFLRHFGLTRLGKMNLGQFVAETDPDTGEVTILSDTKRAARPDVVSNRAVTQSVASFT